MSLGEIIVSRKKDLFWILLLIFISLAVIVLGIAALVGKRGLPRIYLIAMGTASLVRGIFLLKRYRAKYYPKETQW